MLDHRRLRAFFGDDQITRRDDSARRAVLRGDEQQMDRLFDNNAARQVQIGAVGHEDGVERGEDRLLIVVGEIGLEGFRRRFEFLADARHVRAGR